MMLGGEAKLKSLKALIFKLPWLCRCMCIHTPTNIEIWENEKTMELKFFFFFLRKQWN